MVKSTVSLIFEYRENDSFLNFLVASRMLAIAVRVIAGYDCLVVNQLGQMFVSKVAGVDSENIALCINQFL